MKKKVLMGLVLLIVVGASAVFAQSQGTYYLEIWNVSNTTYSTIDSKINDKTWMREDSLFLARTASGGALRSKDRNLSLDEVKQKLLAIAPQVNAWVNQVNSAIQGAQKNGGYNLWITNNNASSPLRVYCYFRRME